MTKNFNMDDLIEHNISTMDIGELEAYAAKTMHDFYSANTDDFEEELQDFIDSQ